MTGQKYPLLEQQGFTLLELLIATVIFAVVISSVYGAYRATFHTIAGTDQQVLQAAAARVVFERVTEDLEALYTAEDGFFEGEQNQLGDGRADSLRFLSSAHLILNREQNPVAKATIEYKGLESESGGFDLIRIDIPYLPGQEEDDGDETQGEILGRGLLSFSLSYFDEDGEQADDWVSGGSSRVDQQPGENQVLELPVLVRVEITFRPDSEEGLPTLYRTSIALPRVYQPEEQQEGG